MPGKVALGPLDENAATLGGSTPLPVTLTVGNILTNGFLEATVNRPQDKDEHTHRSFDQLVKIFDFLKLVVLFLRRVRSWSHYIPQSPRSGCVSRHHLCIWG